MPPGQRLAFISGQGGDNPDGSFSPDFAAQAASAFRNVGLALAAIGAGPANVAKITVLIVDHDMEKLRRPGRAARVLFGAHHPAATLIPRPLSGAAADADRSRSDRRAAGVAPASLPLLPHKKARRDWRRGWKSIRGRLPPLASRGETITNPVES